MKFSEEKVKNIISMYNQGKTQKEIAKYYGTFNTSIRRVLKREGIAIRSNTDIQSYVSSDIFDDLKSDVVNYWLGWLATDGCVYQSRITLQVQEKDLEVIENFKKFLGNSVMIKTIIHSKYKTIGYRVDFKKAAVAQKLVSYGITPKKSFTLNLNIPITFSMLLGIFEGDGHFVFLGKNKNQGKLGITSASVDFLNQIKEFLVLNGFYCTITQSDSLYNLNMHRKQDLIKLYYKLYQNAPYSLKRKREKFGSFVEKSIK